MHVRRFACFLLGAWFAGCVIAAWLGIQNPAAADRLMARLSPEAARQLGGIPHQQSTVLLRYAAAERSRSLRFQWDTLQIACGAFFFGYLLFASREGKWSLAMAAWMFVMVLLQRLYITPESADLGRITDFLPASSAGTYRARLWVLEEAYLLVEAAKWGAGLTLLARFVWSPGRSGDSGQNLDVVDKPNHRHIYR